MDQSTIIDALQKALSKGSGSLDDLENLLKRAQEDVTQAKKDAEAAKEKEMAARGAKVADLATRLLNSETTDDDCAFVMNTWLAAKGYKGAAFTAKEIGDMFDKCEKNAVDDYINKDLNKAINDVVNDLNKWVLSFQAAKDCNKKPEPKPESPDEVLDDFLKHFGLR